MASSPRGRWTFVRVMEQALYHPEWGYYGPGPRRIGRSGDFFTAVSVGPLYGRLLATLAAQVRAELGSPPGFVVIEQAAHDGQLAEDILSAGGPDYLIVEPNPAYRKAQQQRLSPWQGRVQWVTSLAELPAVPALFVCNELPDAMPVHWLRWQGTEWQELYIDTDWQVSEGPLSSPELAEEVARLPQNLPAGYTTEVGLAALHWMRDLAAAPFHGVVYLADYGLDAQDLYAPERTTGTLRRYDQHQSDDRVLENLGNADLTTHVNFTRLQEVGAAGGLRLRQYQHQGRYLSGLATDWLRSLEGRPPDAPTQALLRQFQSLTHPAFLGRSFRVLLMDK